MKKFSVGLMKLSNPILSIIIVVFFSTVGQTEELTYLATQTNIARMSVAILTEAHERINIKLRVEYVPATRALLMANEGAADGEVCRIKGINKEFTNLVRVDPSYISMQSNVFTKDLKFTVEGWHSLKPYKIGIHRGHIYAENATRGFDVTSVAHDEQLLLMLDSGRLDMAIIVMIDGLMGIKNLNLERRIKIIEPPISNIPLYLYLHKKNVHLISKIGTSLREMIEKGRTKEIIKEFLSKEKVESP